MRILLGTLSTSKAAILRKALETTEDLVLYQVDVESGITDQPLDQETTITGSINRALNAQKNYKGSDSYEFSIGLEGGLELISNIFHLVCSAAIVDMNGKVFIGISRKLPLPKKVSDAIRGGAEFGIKIRDFAKDLAKEGVLAEQVEELISREQPFIDAVHQAYKQYTSIRII